MNRKTKACFAVLVLLLLISMGALSIVLLLRVGGARYADRRVDVGSAVETTRAWGRLAAFPASSEDLTVDTEGSAFTRAFRVTFKAPMADLDLWIAASPGLREAVVESIDEGLSKYSITPGEGAAYAEVVITTLSDGWGFVQIYVYWS